MKSSFFINSAFSLEIRNIFFDEFIKYFFDEVDNYCYNTLRKHKNYHIVEYGELTLVNFFINGIVRNDEINRYNIVNEFGIEKINKTQNGRADIIIEDSVCYQVFFIEAKKVHSNENAPNTVNWGKEKSREYYEKVLNQANKYLEVDINEYEKKDKIDFYKIALVFDSTRFTEASKIKNWLFDDLSSNEFYAFKSFENHTIGLACYGKIEKL